MRMISLGDKIGHDHYATFASLVQTLPEILLRVSKFVSVLLVIHRMVFKIYLPFCGGSMGVRPTPFDYHVVFGDNLTFAMVFGMLQTSPNCPGPF